MSKYCFNCGDDLSQGAGICANCGMPVSESVLPRQAPTPHAPAQPPPPPSTPEEESAPLFWQPQRGKPSGLSEATLPSSLPDEDQNGTEPRRGVSRWVARTAGFVGTAAATLVGTVAFWRRGPDALELKSYADSATQQDMGVPEETPVQDRVSGDQIEANLDSVSEIAPADAGTGPAGPELTIDPSLTDPTAPGPTLEVGLIDQVEKIPDLVNVVNRSPELVDAINEDPEFIELCQRYPEFLELCQQYPDFLYLCYHYPQFIQLCYQYPHFIQLCYEYPHFIDVCYEHPQFIDVCQEYPDFFENHPEIVDTVEDNPNLVDLIEQKPTLLDALEDTPDMVEQIDENPDAIEAIKDNPDVVDVIQQNPGVIDAIGQDPTILDDLVTTAAEAQPSPVDESTKTENGESTLDPDLFDPTTPGPTLDTGLAARIAQNPELVEAVNRNEDVARALERDPTSVDQIEQDLGIADQTHVEPSTVNDQVDVPEPEILEAGLSDHDLDDQPGP